MNHPNGDPPPQPPQQPPLDCYIMVHNIAKRHNVGTLVRSATAFGVKEFILVGRRDFNTFGNQGSVSHLTFRHFHSLTDARNFLKDFSHEQLLSLCQTAVTRHPDVIVAARAIADADVSRRKLFVRGLGPETTTESLKVIFTAYGELDEAVVINDKNTGKSKGYGFVTFKHFDGAVVALREPSKRIDGRMTVTHLASAGRGVGEDQATRKIYVGNVPYEISPEKLLDYFAAFGEIEEGPLGFDKQGGKTRGFAFFVYKTEEGARMSLMEPVKMIEGHQVMCKLAEDGKKTKGGANPVLPGEMGGGVGDRMGAPPVGSLGSQYVGGMSHYGPGMGGPGHGPVGSGGGYGGSAGGPYGVAHSQYGGPGSGDYYRMPPPPSSMGVPPPYQESGGAGGYGLSGSGGGYMSQGPPPAQGPPQGPPGGMYQRMPPPYY